jgi:hypothetical protein
MDSPCGCPKSAKVGSDSEPLGGRLHPNRRAERDFCKKKRSCKVSERQPKAVADNTEQTTTYEAPTPLHFSLFTIHYCILPRPMGAVIPPSAFRGKTPQLKLIFLWSNQAVLSVRQTSLPPNPTHHRSR